jgi:DNA-binding PadR family transcriptional regulator
MFNRHFPPLDRPPRLFEKGDLKYVILDLLKDKPSHGYEIIRAMEESFHGFYSPSAGSVYPNLQMLDDMGYASSSEHDGKKIYTISEEGKQFLKEHQEDVNRIKSQMKEWRSPHHNHEAFIQTMSEIRNLGRKVGRNAHQLDSKKLEQIQKVIAGVQDEINNIIGKDTQL